MAIKLEGNSFAPKQLPFIADYGQDLGVLWMSQPSNAMRNRQTKCWSDHMSSICDWWSGCVHKTHSLFGSTRSPAPILETAGCLAQIHGQPMCRWRTMARCVIACRKRPGLEEFQAPRQALPWTSERAAANERTLGECLTCSAEETRRKL